VPTLNSAAWEPDESVEDAYHRALNIMPDQFHDMRKNHGGALQEKHADENILVVDKSAHLPSFCAFSFKEDDPCVVAWIDFWAVEPCSNAETDYARGQKYAEEAISLVRTTRQPAFIECVLIFIGIKLRERNQCAGGFENGLQIALPKSFRELWNGYSCASLQGGQGQPAFRFTNGEMQTSGATHLVHRTR
jgi:hypothetical protein